VDVWLQAHPGQVGSTFNWWNRKVKRIDFMFLVDDPDLSSSEYELVIADPVNVRTIDWGSFLGMDDPPDHRGLEAVFDLREKLSWATVVAAVF